MGAAGDHLLRPGSEAPTEMCKRCALQEESKVCVWGGWYRGQVRHYLRAEGERTEVGCSLHLAPAPHSPAERPGLEELLIIIFRGGDRCPRVTRDEVNLVA